MNIQKENNCRVASTIKHALGYLPAVLLKAIIEDDLIKTKEDKFPVTLSLKTCCLYIDISKLFENSSSNLNKNESNNNNFNYINNLYIPEYYYFFFNRFLEKLISAITNHGGDIIFEGLGAYAIWPPEISDDEDENKEKLLNIQLRTVQCALDLQKKALKTDFSNKTLFFPKIGVSFGECKFIIFKTTDGKFEYTAYGDAIFDAFDCAQKVVKKGQVITNKKLFEEISKYIDCSFIDDESKYLSINALINTANILQNNKSTVNLIRNNFALEEMINKKDILTNFGHYFITDKIKLEFLDDKWFKEIRYLTLLFVRIKMTPADYENPEKLQDTFQIIHNIASRYGGYINKILSDKDGLIYLIAFGIKRHKNSQHETMGVLASFEMCKKLKKNKIVPYIGITSGLSFYGLIGTLGGRKEILIISGLLFFGLLGMEKSEKINEYKKDKFEDDHILIDENTMIMIDSKIPTRFFEKLSTRIGIDLNLFIPQNIEDILNAHYISNLFPLIGEHLHERDDSQFQNDFELAKEENIVFLEEDNLRDITKIMNDFTLNRTNIKLINITSSIGVGKTLLLKKCLDLYFETNEKLKETLINNKSVTEFPFVINANLTFVMNSDILINRNKNEDYRGLQFILKTMFDAIYKSDEGIKKLKKLFNQNKELESYLKRFFLLDNETKLIKENKNKNVNDFGSFNDESLTLTKEKKIKLHQVFINIIKEYKKVINNAYRDVLYETNLYMPLIIIFDNMNICDDLTIEFIKYYLSYDNNDFLLITLQTIPIYPPYAYLDQKQKNIFYDLKNNHAISNIKIELLNTHEKIALFVKSILIELKGIKISSISENLLTFLLRKTFGGNHSFIKRIILNIIEQKFYKIENGKLMENEAFEKMLKYNDFTQLTLSRIFKKSIGEIINALNIEEVCLLKIASLFGDLFELSQLKQVILIDNTSSFVSHLKKGEDDYIYNKLKNLESKYIIEIIEDLDLKNKYVICKFSIPFFREILYQRIPSEQRNQLHYIIGKMTKINFNYKYGKRSKYLSNEDELEMLKNHLKFSEITIHENFLKGSAINNEIINDNLNINNLKTLLTQQICSKISSIKINDDKNNMIKAGYIYKKSDGKLTWEYRYLVLTTNRVVYYYNEEDYKKEEIPPLGIFYLQNLFSVNLLTDGYIGGKKNIFSLSVNEWIKKGNYMTQRIYYLSIEDREELYKWIITFNILKIKAFYDNYSQNFGYVHFPLYNRNKNENSFKPKKNTRFNYELYKDIFIKTNEAKMKNKSQISNKSFIFNKYFLRGQTDSKNEDDDEMISLNNELLFKLKFVIKYTLSIFFSQIQSSLKKYPEEFNDFNPLLSQELIFKIPNFVTSIKKEKIKKDIDMVNEKIKNLNKKKNKKAIELSSQDKKYFNKFHYEVTHPREYKIKFQIKNNIKKYISRKKTEKKYKLFGNDSKNSNSKQEWHKYFREDKQFFKDCQEEKIDTTDNLRYTDFIDKYDINGNLKERYSALYRPSIASKVIQDSVKNTSKDNPILNKLITRRKETDGSDNQKGSSESSESEEKNNDYNYQNNKMSTKQIDDDNDKEDDIINNNEYQEDDKEEKEKENLKNNSSKISIKNKNIENIEKISNKSSEKKKNENKINVRAKDSQKAKKDKKLVDLISDKKKEKKGKLSNKKATTDDNFDFAKIIKKTQDIQIKNDSNSPINKKVEKNNEIKEEEQNENSIQLNTEKGSVGSLFSFGQSNAKVIEIKENKPENQEKENKATYSFNVQDSSMENISNTSEKESDNIDSNYQKKISKDEDSFSNEEEVITNKENEHISFKNIEMESPAQEKEIKISNDSNLKSKKNIDNDLLNLHSNYTEKLSENNDINKFNNRTNNTSSMNSDSKPQQKSKYDYLNELSANRKYIINMKLNNMMKEKNKFEKTHNELVETNSIQKSLDIDMFENLKDIGISLDNEKSLSSYFKRINKENAKVKTIKGNTRNKNGKGTDYSQEMTVQSTNSNFDHAFYPNAYYINGDNHLHSKTHVSMLFTNLKNQNNIYNQKDSN